MPPLNTGNPADQREPRRGAPVDKVSLRGRSIEIAAVLRREADVIEADPYLSPIVRRADAEARRTAAARIEMAVAEDRARPAVPLREGIEQALGNLRRLGDAAVPSRAVRIRAALDESSRLIRAAMDGGEVPRE